MEKRLIAVAIAMVIFAMLAPVAFMTYFKDDLNEFFRNETFEKVGETLNEASIEPHRHCVKWKNISLDSPEWADLKHKEGVSIRQCIEWKTKETR